MTNICKDRDAASMCYANSEEAEAAGPDYIIPLRGSIPNRLAKPKRMRSRLVTASCYTEEKGEGPKYI